MPSLTTIYYRNKIEFERTNMVVEIAPDKPKQVRHIRVLDQYLADPGGYRCTIIDMDNDGRPIKSDIIWARLILPFEAVNQQFKKHGIAPLGKMSDLFHRFGLLDRCGPDGRPEVSWRTFSEMAVHGYEPEDFLATEWMYVSRSWAKDVILIASRGFMGVKSQLATGIIGENPERFFKLIAYKPNNKNYELERIGKHEFVATEIGGKGLSEHIR